LTRRFSIGAVLAGVRHRELVSRARELEAYGIEELWLVEDCFQYGGVSAATAVLGATTNLRVGVGLFPAVVRNVAIFSMSSRP
jgi:alkanesulfonate monooxygenase SsuD/methylene tetrahydromethanopterin reductase-like flavin-dependent oxidoreductase (luciferase family)